MLGGVVDLKEFLSIDPPEIEILWEKVRTGRPCRNDEHVREAVILTNKQLHPFRGARPRKHKPYKLGIMSQR